MMAVSVTVTSRNGRLDRAASLAAQSTALALSVAPSTAATIALAGTIEYVG